LGADSASSASSEETSSDETASNLYKKNGFMIASSRV
jgi:hypothetical protein